MIGLLLSVFLFNFIAYKTNKKLTWNQILHIWLFTISFQQLFDLYVDVGYHPTGTSVNQKWIGNPLFTFYF
ncbi:hypothetical protein A499_20798 [Niallia nealsonii AAU1]|nr:hypothetical protein A499_20798 [Niallia nealsonii AAU1]